MTAQPDPTTPAPENTWDRQPSEPDKAWESFITYRDQGRDRNLRKVARDRNVSLTTIGGYSNTWNWVRRVTAYDAYLDTRRRREREDKLLEMEGRQATQLAASMQALTQPIQAFLSRIAEQRGRGEDPFAGVKTPELQKMATQAIRHMPALVEAERLVAGLSTANVNDKAPASIEEARAKAEAMPRDELESYLLGVDDGRRESMRELGIDNAEAPAG